MRLAMTGLGLMSAIGYGVVPACAALRAGVSRPSPVEWRGVDEDAPEAYRVTGHPVRLLSGLPLLSRWVRLGAWALEELVGASGLERAVPGAWSGTVVLPCLAPVRMEEEGVLDS
jgi:3-oxoacyl-[acyl-carrier-protein] synthase-1